MYLVIWFTFILPSEEQGDGPDNPCESLPTLNILLYSMILRENL